MHVLHVISAPAAGGAEIYIKDLSRALVQQGHTVHIGFLSYAKDIDRESEFEKQFLSELKVAGVKYFFIGHDARKYPWRGMIRVRDYVKRNQIEIYHSHLTYGAVFGALLDVSRVYTHHSIKMRLNRFSFSLVGLFIDHLIGISSVCTETLRAFSGRKVITIVNAIDTARVQNPVVAPRKVNGEISCIAVGRISAPKNYGLLVKSVALLPSDIRSRLKVSIAGEGPESDINALSAQIATEDLGDTIRLIGNRSDISNLLAQSDLFLMSSSHEGLPIALIEAAASGLPCVVTDVGGCREVIEVCRNGAVVEAGNAESMSSAIVNIIRNPAKFTEYSENALRRSPAFSISRATADHAKFYESVVGSRLRQSGQSV